MPGSSITLSLLSESDKQSTSQGNPRVKNVVEIERNATFYPFLTHADHIQHVRAREQPIGIKRKRTLWLSPAHELSIDTNFVRLTIIVK